VYGGDTPGSQSGAGHDAFPRRRTPFPIPPSSRPITNAIRAENLTLIAIAVTWAEAFDHLKDPISEWVEDFHNLGGCERIVFPHGAVAWFTKWTEKG
jgi:hypothetical protein